MQPISLPAALLSPQGFKWTFRPLLRPQRPACCAQECGVCDRHQRLHVGDKDQTGKSNTLPLSQLVIKLG